MLIKMVVALALSAALANAFAWPLLLLVYVTQLRSRKSDQRARLARELEISVVTLKDRKVLGFFHPFW